jgi:hypothetical protein
LSNFEGFENMEEDDFDDDMNPDNCVLTNEDLRATLNAHLSHLLTPEMTDQVINLTIKGIGKLQNITASGLEKGLDNDSLLKFQTDLIEKQIKQNKVSELKRARMHKFIPPNSPLYNRMLELSNWGMFFEV